MSLQANPTKLRELLAVLVQCHAALGNNWDGWLANPAPGLLVCGQPAVQVYSSPLLSQWYEHWLVRCCSPHTPVWLVVTADCFCDLSWVVTASVSMHAPVDGVCALLPYLEAIEVLQAKLRK